MRLFRSESRLHEWKPHTRGGQTISDQPSVKKQHSKLTPERLDKAAGYRGSYAFESARGIDSEVNYSGMTIEKVELAIEKIDRG